MWMLHGDVGEDNLVPGVLNKSDSTPDNGLNQARI